MLKCEQLTIRFGGLSAIDRLDFEIAAGEIRGGPTWAERIRPNGKGGLGRRR